MSTALALAALFAAHGCSVACQSGIVANFSKEVGPSLTPCAVSRSGIGLPQLGGPLRRRYLAKAGSNWCDPKRQVEFVIEVLGEMGIRDRLFRERDPGAAARLFMLGFERPRRLDPSSRIRRARELYHELMTTTAMVTP